jgi:hypothetical protein
MQQPVSSRTATGYIPILYDLFSVNLFSNTILDTKSLSKDINKTDFGRLKTPCPNPALFCSHCQKLTTDNDHRRERKVLLFKADFVYSSSKICLPASKWGF